MTHTYRAVIEGTIAGQKVANVLHYTGVDNVENDIADYLAATAALHYQDILNDSGTLDQAVCTNLNTLGQSTTAITLTGSEVGDMCPPQASAVISWRTAKVGRKYRGRTYLFGIPETMQTDGTLSAGYLTGMGLLAVDLITGILAETSAVLVVYHKPATPGTVGDSTPVISYLLRPTVYNQRRRTLGVGT